MSSAENFTQKANVKVTKTDCWEKSNIFRIYPPCIYIQKVLPFPPEIYFPLT